MAENQNELNNLVVNFPPKPGVLNKLKSAGWFNDSSAKSINDVLPEQMPSGGSAATPGDIANAIGRMTEAQRQATLAHLKAAEALEYVFVSGTTPVITPEPNKYYRCGTLSSLTITDSPSTGGYAIVFTSGETATDLSVDPAIKMPDGFSVDANKIYEIIVLENRAAVSSWAVTM